MYSLVMCIVFSFIVFLIVYFIVSILHELIHAVVAWVLGVRVKRIVIGFGKGYVEIEDTTIDKVVKIALAPLILSIISCTAGLILLFQDIDIDYGAILFAAGTINLVIMSDDFKLAYRFKLAGKGRATLAFLGIIFVAVATLLQMIVDWYQSYALGIPQSTLIKALVLVAGILTLLALVLSLKGSGVRR